MGSHQLPALRPNTASLRALGPVPRSCAVHLQVPPLERIPNTRIWAHAHIESDLVPSPHATSSLAASWICDRGRSGLDHRVRTQEGDTAWDDQMETSCMACRRLGAEREVRQSEEKDGG